MSIEEAGEIELRELMERTEVSKEREKRKSVLESAKQRFRDLFSAEDGELEEGEAPVAKRPKVDG